MRPILPSGFGRTLLLVAAGLSLLPCLAILVTTIGAYDGQLQPEAVRGLQAVGRTVALPLERAFAIGIPFAQLRGVDSFLDAVLSDNPAVQQIAIDPAPGSAAAGYRRTAPGEAGGWSVQVPVAPAGRAMATVTLTEQASVTEAVYRTIVRDLLVAAVVALIAGALLTRCLVGVLLAAPAEMAEQVLAGAMAGDLSRVAAHASAGGEIGALLATVNRLVRQLSDRVEELLIYAREVRVVAAGGAAAGRVEQLSNGVQRRFRLSPAMVSLQPAFSAPLAGFAGLVAMTALVLQVPALSRLASGLGGAGRFSVVVGILLAALVPGGFWAAAVKKAGRRLTLLLALAMALLPQAASFVLPPGAGRGWSGAVLGAVLPLAAVAGLTGMVRMGAGRAGADRSLLQATIPGLACGCGLIGLIPYDGVIGGLSACLTVLTFLLLLSAPPADGAPAALDLAGLVRALGQGRVALSAGLEALAALSLFGIAAAILPEESAAGLGAESLSRWAQLTFYAAAAMLGHSALSDWRDGGSRPGPRLYPAAVATAALLLAALLVAPQTSSLVPLGLLTGCTNSWAQSNARRAVAGLGRHAAALPRVAGFAGAAAGLLAGALLSVEGALAWLGAVPAAAVIVAAMTVARGVGTGGRNGR